MTNDIGKIGKLLMMKEPFYGFFLLNLNKEFSTSLPTAGVGLNGINQMLYINPEFWDKLSENHKIGLLKHELN
jgi:predicted metal-dependent peptidase